MKKLLSLSLALVLCLGLMAGCTKAEDPAKDPGADAGKEPQQTTQLKTVSEGQLIMSTNAAFPPYEMRNDADEFIGIDVEIAGLIADKLGLKLKVDDMDFTAALDAVQGGRSDIAMAGITVKPERELVMDFSDSYTTGIQVVIVPEDSDIATIADLEGKKIGTQMGTTGYLYCSDTPENGGFGEDAVVPYDNGYTAVQNLLNGQVDCVVIDNAPAQEFVKANPGLKILDTEYKKEDYAIGFAKGNTALKDAVNAALKELIADGSVQKVIDKYIPPEG